MTVPVDVLGATYLGGTGFATLASAGRFDAPDPAILISLDSMFRTAQAPFCAEVF